MVRLGVGKNMVRAIRFWTETAGMSIEGDGGWRASDLGAALLCEAGYDPFLEDLKTLWLIHWNISTTAEPLFAWDYLLNSWHRSDFTRCEAVQCFVDEAARLEKRGCVQHP